RSSAIDFWRRTSANTVIKLGRHGSQWIAPSVDIRAAAARVRAIETTGAGDAFDGGILFAFLRGATPYGCLRAGNIGGARATPAAGGIAALPTRLPPSIRSARTRTPAPA